MEVINKSHEKIFVNERVHLSSYVSFNNRKAIYFSAGASRELGMKAGMKVNFINDEDMWMFYLDNNEDGFELVEREDKNAVLLCNAPLIELFLKRTRCGIPSKFPLRLTNAEVDGHKIIKIDLLNPI